MTINLSPSHSPSHPISPSPFGFTTCFTQIPYPTPNQMLCPQINDPLPFNVPPPLPAPGPWANNTWFSSSSGAYTISGGGIYSPHSDRCTGTAPPRPSHRLRPPPPGPHTAASPCSRPSSGAPRCGKNYLKLNSKFFMRILKALHSSWFFWQVSIFLEITW